MRRFIFRWLMMLLLTLGLLSGCAAPASEGESRTETTQQSNKELSAQEKTSDAVGQAASSEQITPIGSSGQMEQAGSSEQKESEESSVQAEPADSATQASASVTEDGVYDSKDEVALYIHLYGHLPSNYLTKKEAEKLGWEGGSLEPFAPGCCIGGSRFGNYEGALPEADGRTYKECDIDTLGAEKRGAKRIVFSNDGLIYYTEDHYESFELLYGEE